jgi:hypothetical protein
MVQSSLHELMRHYFFHGTNVCAWAHEALPFAWYKCACMSTWGITFCIVQICLHEHVRHDWHGTNVRVWACEALPFAWYKCACMSTWGITLCMVQMCLHEHEALPFVWYKYACMSMWGITGKVQMCLSEHVRHYLLQGTNVPAQAHEAWPARYKCAGMLPFAWYKCACKSTWGITFCVVQMCLYEHMRHYTLHGTNVPAWARGITLCMVQKCRMSMWHMTGMVQMCLSEHVRHYLLHGTSVPAWALEAFCTHGITKHSICWETTNRSIPIYVNSVLFGINILQ